MGAAVGVLEVASAAVEVGLGRGVSIGTGLGSLEHPTMTTQRKVATVSAERKRKWDWCEIGIVRPPSDYRSSVSSIIFGILLTLPHALLYVFRHIQRTIPLTGLNWAFCCLRL